eukprot:Protomagalhaensia_wolfi_Nauph_80__2057@NODE_2312_length_1130_cov_4_539872_g1811_i0_p1_GENE_NODE_2312_length_1130_cov_4_539872_g1811_i0NODE_2312_length_1130_cov_4_539872_g1811_i0_p1_ORF_typecomplete_len200_score18_89ABC_tran/PF00005_27/3e17_NODE_2312_length_1130_cov_4_539872_g1811_i05231122
MGGAHAGKSTLLESVMRLVDVIEGDILVDGVPLSDLSIREIRDYCGFMPQEPAVFTGSIRDNLDPFNVSTTDQIWMALEMVGLKSFVKALDRQLSSIVDQSFSLHERHLLSLAQVYLRRPPIILVDATEGSTVHKQVTDLFASSTIIAVVHCMSALAAFDKVRVLNAGAVLGFGPSGEVLRQLFSKHFFSNNLARPNPQ